MSSTSPKLELTIQSSEGVRRASTNTLLTTTSRRLLKSTSRFLKEWSERPTSTTNFDLCAFATGMGYVDLCSGAFALTHRRQAMTFMIELYTSPVFMVSKSKCNFFASEDWGSWKFWFWWVDVFSLGAWGFFVGVVFFFIVAMKGLDKCLDCLDNLDRQSGEEPEEQGEPEEPPEEPEKPQDKWQRRVEKFCKCFCCFTHGLADALLGVFEAFVNKSNTSHRRDPKKPSRSRPSHMLRLGLGFFVLLSTAVYGAGITANMIQAKEVEGEVPNLEEAKSRPNRVSVCTHSVFEESLESHWNDKILAVYLDTWECKLFFPKRVLRVQIITGKCTTANTLKTALLRLIPMVAESLNCCQLSFNSAFGQG